MYFITEEEEILEAYRERFIAYQKQFIRKVCENTPYESFVIGCSYSCNSLLGPNMWRQWDKPYIRAMADEIHKHGKLLHIHFHGRSIETVADFAEIGIDCVCPFERGPGGDVDGMEGLREVRRLLDDKVTMNGNVHTVETLIRGKPEDVRREVRQIKEVFSGSSRLIIGTGDQVGLETPEENILAMIDEAKR
jgi:uroporphyrinogen-III decarboxylase